MSKQRFFVAQQIDAKTPEENILRLEIAIKRLTEQLNIANLPIVVGPNDTFPEGLKVGQPVLDWRSGISTTKIWNGQGLI